LARIAVIIASTAGVVCINWVRSLGAGHIAEVVIAEVIVGDAGRAESQVRTYCTDTRAAWADLGPVFKIPLLSYASFLLGLEHSVIIIFRAGKTIPIDITS